MSETKPATTTWPHEDLIAENKINVSELPEKTQRKIKKFAEATDDDTKESLDEVLFGEIDDVVDAKKKAEKKAAVNQKREEHKTKKKTMDVSGAATANPPAGSTPTPPAPRGLMKTILGLK